MESPCTTETMGMRDVHMSTQAQQGLNWTDLDKIHMLHDIHCLELFADIFIIPFQHFTVFVGM